MFIYYDRNIYNIFIVNFFSLRDWITMLQLTCSVLLRNMRCNVGYGVTIFQHFPLNWPGDYFGQKVHQIIACLMWLALCNLCQSSSAQPLLDGVAAYRWGFFDHWWKSMLQEEIPSELLPSYCSGVTKALLVNFPIMEIFPLSKIPVKFW